MHGGGILVAPRDGPERRLPPVARPGAAGIATYRVPPGIVLTVVVALREHQPLFRPDDTRMSKPQAAGLSATVQACSAPS